MDGQPVLEMEKPQVEDVVAEAAHAEWCRRMTEAGWVFGKPTNNPSKKHSRLCPWGEMTEEGKAEWRLYVEAVTHGWRESGYAMQKMVEDPEALPVMAQAGAVHVQGNQRLRRVRVRAGRGVYAYWFNNQPNGLDAGFDVVADIVDNPQASHRAGKLIEAHEGKPNSMTWMVEV